MRHAHLFRTLLVIALLVVTPMLVFGQAVNFATIHGRVTDKSDAAVMGAQVKATQVGTGLVRTTTSNAEGIYSLTSLPVGAWQIDVTAKGFRSYVQKGLTLAVGDAPTINIALEVGAVTETVEVHADASMVSTQENTISTLIDNTRILEMPLNGRNAPDLIMLSGNASNAPVPSQDINSTKNYGNGTSGASQTVSVGGSQQNANNYLLDGGDNNDQFTNVNAPLPNPDAIQEFSVQASGLPARYGKQAGAVVNVVTKSGTNNFHGTAFEFLRNPIINASTPLFQKPSTTYRDDSTKRNQFGGTFGGPIMKDKLMFFTSYQGLRLTNTPGATTANVPTAAMLAGDWSACPKKFAANGWFVNNKIDLVAHPFNQQSLNLVKYLPTSTDPCGAVTFTVPVINNEDQGIVKVDWNISSKHQAFVRYFITDFRQPVAFDASNILTQANSSQFSRYQNGVIGDTYTFSNGMVNSFHFTAKRMAVNRGPASGMINPKTLGVNVSTPIPEGMVLSVGNYFNVGGGSQMPYHGYGDSFQVANDIDWVKGKHQISFGANFMHMQHNYLSTYQSNGQFTFSGQYTGDNLADFLLGQVSSFTQGNPEAENWRMKYFGAYVHDTYKMTPHLTINAGVRWEPFFPSKDAFNRGSHFDYDAFVAGTRSTVFPKAPAGLFFCGDPGIPCAYQNQRLGQFAPRVGLVWDPKGDGKQTLRAAYGVFFDSPEMYYFDRYADNGAYGAAMTFTPTAAGGFTNPYTGISGVPASGFPTPFPTPGDPNAFFPGFGTYINNNLDVKPMYVQNWNVSYERQITPNWLISANYIGSKTTHIWVAYEANPGLNVSVAANTLGCPTGAASTKNTNCRRALYVAGAALQAAQGLPTNPGAAYGNMTSLWDGANSEYNALLLSAKHRFSKNFSAMTNYTWSHCISDQDFSGELTNSRPTLYPSPVSNPNYDQLANDRGNCSFDVRHSIAGSLVLSSPKFSGAKGKVLNDWQLAPLVTYRTGLPFTVTTGADTAMIGATTSYKDRMNLVGDPSVGVCPADKMAIASPVGTRNCWFNDSAFALPTAAVAPYGPFGNVARNSMYGPSAFRFDASVSRKINIAEGKSLTLRFETFNVFNKVNLGNPNSSYSADDPKFGKILGTTTGYLPRQFQLAAKFTF